MKKLICILPALLPLVMTSCNKDESSSAEKDYSEVAQLDKETELTGLGLSLSKMKILHYPASDAYSMRAKLVFADTAKGVSYHSYDFLEDDGYLYDSFRRKIGEKSYLELDSRIYEARAESSNPLIVEFPLILQLRVNKFQEAGTQSQYVVEHFDMKEQTESPYKDIKAYQDFDNVLASRTYYEKNSGYASKGKMGCVVFPANVEGNSTGESTFLYEDVELGNKITHSAGHLFDTAATDTSGNDDELWIRWEERWLITAIDLANRKMRVLRHRYAPFYHARQLPGQNLDATAPILSGVEKLIRRCNQAAASANGSFQIFAFEDARLRVALNGSRVVNFCEPLKTASDGDEAAQNAIPLEPFSNRTVNQCASLVSSLNIQEGRWNGTANRERTVQSTGPERYYHLEQSEIVEIEFSGPESVPSTASAVANPSLTKI